MGDNLSQAELDELFNNHNNKTNQLTEQQIDVIGEIGNISMGTSASTLFTALNQKVSITTPKVKLSTYREIIEFYDAPCVAVRVDYRIGVSGTNILVLSQNDVKIITDLMMGGNGQNIDEASELSEINLSAIGEVMNQMIGSAATSLSSIIGEKVDIDTPRTFKIDSKTDDLVYEELGVNPEGLVVSVAFDMKIGELIDSTLIQIMDYDFTIRLVDLLLNSKNEVDQTEVNESKEIKNNDTQNNDVQNNKDSMMTNSSMLKNDINKNSNIVKEDVDVNPAKFENFDISEVIQQKENINIIMDVDLEVTVELGKTRKSIKEILEFSTGTIIELNKLAGEPIDILVNGKLIANGEVVVIDENFGIRITEIINKDNII